MRPEDVVLDDAANRFCANTGIEPSEVKDARARGQYVAEEEVEAGWYVVIAERQGAPGKLRMLCYPHPNENIVADVRLID